MGKKVEFIVIGAMKCGTSTLTTELSRHPQVGFCANKEPDFFIREDWREHVEEFEVLFPAGSQLIRGEGSTSYTKRPAITPDRIAADIYDYNPDMKLIYIMRDPVERLVSHYKYNRHHGAKLPAIEEAIQAHPHLLNVGRYYYQLEPYLRQFNREQLLLLTLEEYRQSREKVMQKIARFLGIDPKGFGPYTIHQGNSRVVRNRRMEQFIASEAGQTIKKIFPQRWQTPLRNRLNDLFSKKAKAGRVDLSAELQTHLRTFYKEDVHQLEKLMGPAWIGWQN